MARTKTTDMPTRGVVWAAYPDGPTYDAIADESSPWFVDAVIRENYTTIATDELRMRQLTEQDHPANVMKVRLAFGQLWRDRQGQAPLPDDTTLQVSVGGRADVKAIDWAKDAQLTVRASDEAIFWHMRTLGEAWRVRHQAEFQAKRAEVEKRANTCVWCGEYEFGQGQKCLTCETALEYERLRRAADSQRGKRAIAKIRAVAKD